MAAPEAAPLAWYLRTRAYHPLLPWYFQENTNSCVAGCQMTRVSPVKTLSS